MGKRDRTPDAAIDGGWLTTRAEERGQHRIYGCCIGDGPGGQLLREGLFEERGVHVRRNASLRLCDHGIRVYVGLPKRRDHTCREPNGYSIDARCSRMASLMRSIFV